MTTTPQAQSRPVGDLLRMWRQRRSLSQLELALRAEVSARHVSFLETGRSQPSREMLLHLAEELDIPLRERNTLLMAAGFAPVYAERSLDDPALRASKEAVELVLAGHEPYPALAVDRHWTLVTANRAIAPLLEGIAPDLLQPPINVLRLSLHPSGLAPRVANLEQWRNHVLTRLHRQIDLSGDEKLVALLEELRGYGTQGSGARTSGNLQELDYAGVVVPMRIQTSHGLLSLFGTTTVFGTPVDITLAELAIESFFPADPQTAAVLRRIAEEGFGSDA
ncbi:helix-turn-helix domain-containing protein [Hyalangium versicolor]|uniref:helix-turn-helix domain-containing protein n=1 Tax=Hyalangium versicolor TaxID=2861190 RepID=UPI001CCE1D1B|nr:helix-turn-helix transcriptional regulator [Hyalangium versicolor]